MLKLINFFFFFVHNCISCFCWCPRIWKWSHLILFVSFSCQCLDYIKAIFRNISVRLSLIFNFVLSFSSASFCWSFFCIYLFVCWHSGPPRQHEKLHLVKTTIFQDLSFEKRKFPNKMLQKKLWQQGIVLSCHGIYQFLSTDLGWKKFRKMFRVAYLNFDHEIEKTIFKED